MGGRAHVAIAANAKRHVHEVKKQCKQNESGWKKARQISNAQRNPIIEPTHYATSDARTTVRCGSLISESSIFSGCTRTEEEGPEEMSGRSTCARRRSARSQPDKDHFAKQVFRQRHAGASGRGEGGQVIELRRPTAAERRAYCVRDRLLTLPAQVWR